MPVTILFDKQVNMQKLIRELAAAGFFRTSYKPGEFIVVEDANDTAAVRAVYDAHVSVDAIKQEQIDRQTARLQLKELKADFASAEASNNVPAQNVIRREISRIKYMTQGV